MRSVADLLRRGGVSRPGTSCGREDPVLVPGLTIVVRDERAIDGADKTEETFR